MASKAYFEWLAAGKPYKLAAPLVALRDKLRRYGYTVYDIGNERHQKAEPPEDHMPYSATGWPVASPRWWGFAIDVMPPPAGSGLPTLAQLGKQLHDDRRNGVAGTGWLKYMNWEPGDGNCWHDSWQPTYARRSSGDRGHIHLSGRSDQYLTDTLGDYDPVARIREGADVADLPAYNQNAILYTDNRVAAFNQGDETVKGTASAPHAKGEAVWPVRKLNAIGTALDEVRAAVTAPPPPANIAISDDQAEAIAQRVAELVVQQLTVTGTFQFTATPTAQ